MCDEEPPVPEEVLTSAKDQLDDDQRRQGYPWKFYGLTEDGRTFLEEHNLLAAEETLQQIYETISDKPEKMIKYENAPRPKED